MTGWKALLALAAIATLPTLPATACDGQAIAFSDDFKTLDPSWGSSITDMAPENGHLAMKPPATGSGFYATHYLNQSGVYTDATYCVTLDSVSTTDASNTFAGIAFWGLDDTSFYTFVVSPTGSFEVLRKVAANRFLSPVSWTPSSAIQKDKPQELQVVTKGNVATLFVDGTKVGELKGQPPAGGGTFGLFFQLPFGANSKYVVSNAVVKN